MFDRIQKRCKELGLTIKAVEQMAGLGQGAISKWKTSTPRTDALFAVAKILQVTPEWLFLGIEIEESPAPYEGEAPLAHVIAAYQAAPRWLQDQVLALLKAAEVGDVTQDDDSTAQ